MPTRIKPEVHAVLRNSRIAGNTLTLPGQLDPKLYAAVKKVIENHGGKWVRAKGTHIIPDTFAADIGLALESGTSVSEKEKFQAFYTPPGLATLTVSTASVSGHIVLEPSAGGGALADECIQQGAAAVHCVEIRQAAADALARRHPATRCADFLQLPVTTLYERIVMNPPFSRGLDLKHVQAALRHLAPGGILVAIIAGNLDRAPLDAILDEHSESSVRPNAPQAFAASGTLVSTATLWLRKPAHIGGHHCSTARDTITAAYNRLMSMAA